MAIGPIQLLKQASPEQRRTLLAAALGWMLDAFDAMLYALVLAHVMRDLGMSKATSGLSTRCGRMMLAVRGRGRPRHTPDMVLPSLAKTGTGLIISSQRPHDSPPLRGDGPRRHQEDAGRLQRATAPRRRLSRSLY